MLCSKRYKCKTVRWASSTGRPVFDIVMDGPCFNVNYQLDSVLRKWEYVPA